MSALNGEEACDLGVGPMLPENNPSAVALGALAAESRFLPSQRFIISCGTVTLDTRVGKVLLVYNKPNGIYQLPKGRKNIGEDGLLQTALRETREETGYDVRPLTLEVPTRSTPLEDAGATNGAGDGAGATTTGSTAPATAAAAAGDFVRLDGEEVPHKGLTLGVPNQEPIACCHWSDPHTQALKMIFHFAAEADSTAAPRGRPAEDVARHQAYWVDYADAVKKLWYDEERKAVQKALCELGRMG